MDEVCTCGARVLADARFCHKCGRPLREEAVVAEGEPPIPASAPTAAPPPAAQQAVPIGFGNPTAVRVALLTAVITSLACLLAIPVLVGAAWLLAAVPVAGGFVAVYLYNRRTGHAVSILGGARIGWLTGIFCFVIVIVLVTLAFAMVASIGVEEAARMANSAGGNARPDQFREVISSPAAIIFTILAWFVLLTSLPTIGGALGAKVFERL